jgi:hypothetical protein
MSKNVVKVGEGIEYEVEILNSITEASFTRAAIDELLQFADENYRPIEGADIQRYRPTTPKERKEFRLFDSVFHKMQVILACDKEGVIESVQQLLDLARKDKESFEEIYQAAIKDNPTLAQEAEKESNPETKN